MELKTSEFLAMTSRGRVLTARWANETITGNLGADDRATAYTVKVPRADSLAGSEIATLLTKANVEWTYDTPSLVCIQISLVPILTFIAGAVIGVAAFFLFAKLKVPRLSLPSQS